MKSINSIWIQNYTYTVQRSVFRSVLFFVEIKYVDKISYGLRMKIEDNKIEESHEKMPLVL